MTEEYSKGYKAGADDANAQWEIKVRGFVAWLKSIEAGEYAHTHNDYALAIRGIIVRLFKTGISHD